MSAQAIDFSKYASAAPASIDFSQYEGAPAAKPNITMQPSPMSTAEEIGAHIAGRVASMAGHAVDAGKSIANDVYDVSTPNVATQLYRHTQGLPNSLDKIPAKAVGAFFTAAGMPEEELAESVAASRAEKTAVAAPREAAATAAQPTSAAALPTPKITPAAVGQQLNDALGGQKLVPGVPLRSQPAAQAAAAGKLPDGFIAVDSTALKGYKYSPDAREFESITQGGQHYVHGDVSPEEAQTFAAADSKGKAWQQLRSQNPLVAKVVNGQRVAVKPAASAAAAETIPAPAQPRSLQDLSGSPSAKPPVASSNDDLTAMLQKSLDQVNAKKGVQTSFSPAELTKRWGVDDDSLASGREQTRGMTTEETESDVKQLTAAYKKGAKVEPVIENRDAANNIISVDGRARAIAARRAGIQRIPVIVRRAAAATGQ